MELLCRVDVDVLVGSADCGKNSILSKFYQEVLGNLGCMKRLLPQSFKNCFRERVMFLSIWHTAGENAGDKVEEYGQTAAMKCFILSKRLL